MQEQEQQFNDCFQIDLKTNKIIDIQFLSGNTLLIRDLSNKYKIITIIQRGICEDIKQGILPCYIEYVHVVDQKRIIFLKQNQLCLFEVYLGQIIDRYLIGASNISCQSYSVSVTSSLNEINIIYFKYSIIKTQQTTVFYQIHQLKLQQKLQKIKKLKIQYPDLRNFGYNNFQIFSYQTKGFTIQIHFLQSQLVQKIQSIYYLFLIKTKLINHQVQFVFSHQNIQNKLVSWSVNKARVKKLQRQTYHLQPHVYQDQTALRSIVVKNMFNLRKKDPNIAIFRMKANKKSLYLKILDSILSKNTTNNFKQSVISMLN